MEILDAKIDWKDDVANSPRLQVLVDEIPSRDDLRFEEKKGLFVAEHPDGYVEYFAWSGDGNDGGYGGRSFKITMADGETVVLQGPWSSRAGGVNKTGLGPVVDVSLTDSADTFERGFTFTAGALTLAAAKQAIDMADDPAYLRRVEKFDANEPYWIPTRRARVSDERADGGQVEA